MRCMKALIKTDAGLNAVIDSKALVCQSFASGGGSLLLAEEYEMVQLAVHVLSAVALYKDTGHRAVLGALEELYFFHAAAVDDKPKPFEPLVDRLREQRTKSHAAILTLINALVSGCTDIGVRVKMRDELANLDFIELTRPMITSAGAKRRHYTPLHSAPPPPPLDSTQEHTHECHNSGCHDCVGLPAARMHTRQRPVHCGT